MAVPNRRASDSRDWLTRITVDPYRASSVSGRARARRWTEFRERFPMFGEMSVLDLGGTPDFWRSAPVRPAHVTTVNVDAHQADEGWITTFTGDACELPARVRTQRFDLVVSNSVLEHVGGHGRRERFAEVVHAMADRHWVQTPYRYFPIEPHWLFPGVQWMPVAARAWVSRHWRYGHMHRADWAASVREACWTELVSKTEMRLLFPRSELWVEHLAWIPKSLVALRS